MKESEPELQFFQSELNRIIDWIQFSDKKGALLAAFYSAIFGFLISQKETIAENVANVSGIMVYFYWIVITIITISFLTGITLLILSIFPRLKNSFTEKSFCFFGTIACMKYVDFSKEFERMSEESFKKQITEQIYTNSLIANQKMKNVQKSIQCFVVLSIFTAVIAFLLN